MDTDVTAEPESLAYIPRFSEPTLSPSLDPHLSASPETDTGLYEPPIPRPDPSDTRTTTSASTGERQATKAEIAELCAALLAALAVGAGLLVRLRSRNTRKLRQPTKEHCREVGNPLGRIAARHVPVGKLAPDLADAVLAAVGLTSYLDAGPLTVYEGLDSGMPDNLQESL